MTAITRDRRFPSFDGRLDTVIRFAPSENPEIIGAVNVAVFIESLAVQRDFTVALPLRSRKAVFSYRAAWHSSFPLAEREGYFTGII
jgi:hypothetical protein